LLEKCICANSSDDGDNSVGVAIKAFKDEVYLGKVKGSTLEWNDDDEIEEAFS